MVANNPLFSPESTLAGKSKTVPIQLAREAKAGFP